MGVLFVGMGILQAWPGRGFWSGQAHTTATSGTLTTMVRQMSQVSQPSVFSSWVRTFADFQAGHAWAVNFVVVVLLIGIGLSFFSNNLRIVRVGLAAGAVLCLAVWVLIQDFGFFGGVGTDPNSMIPMTLIFGGAYLAVVRLPARATVTEPVAPVAGAVATAAPATRAGGWLDRLSPNYLLRSLLAIGALAIVLVGAGPHGRGRHQPQCRPHPDRGGQRFAQSRRRSRGPVHPHRPARTHGLALVRWPVAPWCSPFSIRYARRTAP